MIAQPSPLLPGRRVESRDSLQSGVSELGDHPATNRELVYYFLPHSRRRNRNAVNAHASGNRGVRRDGYQMPPLEGGEQISEHLP